MPGRPQREKEEPVEERLHLLKGALKNRFQLMEAFLPELRRTPEAEGRDRLEARFLRATKYGQRILAIRLAVLVLLSSTAILSFLSGSASFVLDVPGVKETLGFVAYVAGVTTGVSGIAYLVLGRYLDLVTVSATFLAMQLAAAPGPEAPLEETS